MSCVSDPSSRKIWAILVCIFLFSCSTEYTGQYYSFPPGSKPHENDWEYTMVVFVSSNNKPISKKSKKIVEINVYDRNNINYLTDHFEFLCASIEAKVLWESFEEIRISLYEVGNEYANDLYNQQLIKTGPIELIDLKYLYDNESMKFVTTK